MNGFNAAIHIAEPCSCACHSVAFILHVFAAGVCTILSFNSWLFLVPGMTIGISFYISQNAYHQCRRQLVGVLLRSDNGWTLVTRDGQQLYAARSRPPFVCRFLMVVFLKDQFEHRWLLTFAHDNVPQNTLRRLFVRLRFE